MNKHKNAAVSPGKLFKEEGTNNPILDEIPLSAFESSSSSASSDTFESYYEKDQLIEELKRDRQQIIVERLSEDEDEDEDSANAAEEVMISLSDIPVEIDQGLDDKRQNGFSQMHADNGKAFRYNCQKEKEVKLSTGESCFDRDSVSDFVPRQLTGYKGNAYIDCAKTTNGEKLDNLKTEVFLETTLRELERQMVDSSKF